MKQRLRPWLRWMPRWLVLTALIALYPVAMLVWAVQGMREGTNEWQSEWHEVRHFWVSEEPRR